MKRAMNAMSELIEFRVELMALPQGRPFKGIRALENRWKSLFRRAAGALDSMSSSIQRDWAVIRKEREQGIRPPRRVKGIENSQGDA